MIKLKIEYIQDKDIVIMHSDDKRNQKAVFKTSPMLEKLNKTI